MCPAPVDDPPPTTPLPRILNCRCYNVYDVSTVVDAAAYRLEALSKLPQYSSLAPIFKALIDMGSDPTLLDVNVNYSGLFEIEESQRLLFKLKQKFNNLRKSPPSTQTLTKIMTNGGSSTTGSQVSAGRPNWEKIKRYLRIVVDILELILDG
ncbi:unnamed protein product [Strongylus vulgaris]|uniref:Uncharacterized protein n=1 Tax=Strongylus vulgaris TaxID=40348 RepID=A0A3P7J3S1_STRVU|nr:unnamed protein product [Strongylus vulgaris]